MSFGSVCYEGVIVTCYNQVKSRSRKRKEKYSRNPFSFLFYLLEEASFSTVGRELSYN